MNNSSLVVESVNNSIQELPKQPVEYGSGLNIMSLLWKSRDIIPPWWSTSRDIELRKFWKQCDQLAGVMYTFQSKMTTIPFRVVPRDLSIKQHSKIADEYTRLLYEASEFGKGWNSFYSPFLEDLTGQDNGAFAEVIGGGDKSGPIVGPAISVAHLDSANCTRTGNPIFPVVYVDPDSQKSYKMHYTRVMTASQLPSANSRMHGVGLCAISRCVNIAQNLIDISIYKQEKLGSRPQRKMLITQGGLTPEDVANSFAKAEVSMNSQGLSRYSKTVVVGSQDTPMANIVEVDLANMPDGFDEETTIVLGMATIALAWGMDARELFPSSKDGGTKADAIISHIKQRGKAPGQTLEIMEFLFNQKFLPPFLKMVFDYQDDAEDRQQAEIRNIRAQGRDRDMRGAITNKRVEREKMLQGGELTESQFEELELEDGRLDDGNSVLILFHSNDKDYLAWLGDVNVKVIDKDILDDKKIDLMTFVSASRDVERIKKARRAIAAIEFLIKKNIELPIVNPKLSVQPELPIPDIDVTKKPKLPDTSYQDTDKYGITLNRNPVGFQEPQSAMMNNNGGLGGINK